MNLSGGQRYPLFEQPGPVQYVNGSRNVSELHMQRRRSIPNRNTKNQPSSPRYLDDAELVILPCCFAEDGKEKTKIYNARAQLLFCSLNLLFGDVLVAVVVMAVCLSSLTVIWVTVSPGQCLQSLQLQRTTTITTKTTTKTVTD